LKRRPIVMLAYTPLVVAVLITAVTAVSVLTGTFSRVAGDPTFLWGVLTISIVFTAIGGILSSRRPDHPIGWILSTIGLFQALNGGVASWTVLADAHGFPGGDFANWWGTWNWIPSVGLLVTFLLLLFPTGHPPSPRWRPVAWTAAVGITLLAGSIAVQYWPIRHELAVNTDVESSGLGTAIGIALLLVAALASVASLVVRFRRARGDERQQLRWFVGAGAITVLGFFLAIFISASWGVWLIVPGFLAIPIAAGIAVLKYRLYDLDVVIKKALIALVLTALIAAVGLFFVAEFGQVAFWEGTNPRVSVLIGVAGGLLIGPLLRLSRRIAARITFGRRATPYEVLTEFSDRVGETYATEDVLPRMAQVLAAGTGATNARVLLKVGGELREEASSGEPGIGTEHTAPVVHQGEELGALAVEMPANDPMDPARERLVHDVAAQAGLVLRNVRLIEELRASRQRLVAAQDEERRRIERNLHDGAQQQLVALSVQLKLAEQLATKDLEKTHEALVRLQGAAGAALEDLRDLARGIYPPLLADKGLPTAIEAQARKAAVPTAVDAKGIGRYPQEIEAAVYFSVLEALNNVAKYAEAAHATIVLAQTDGRLEFRVSDDGAGFDATQIGYGTGLQGMADRLDAIGGRLSVTSMVGTGTTIIGNVPISARGGGS
jgi:signal transduction histidine kinase